LSKNELTIPACSFLVDAGPHLPILEIHSSSPRLSLLSLLTNTLPDPSASEVTTLWRYTNVFIIIIIIRQKAELAQAQQLLTLLNCANTSTSSSVRSSTIRGLLSAEVSSAPGGRSVMNVHPPPAESSTKQHDVSWSIRNNSSKPAGTGPQKPAGIGMGPGPQTWYPVTVGAQFGNSSTMVTVWGG